MKPGVGQQNDFTIVIPSFWSTIAIQFCWATPGFIIRPSMIQLYETGGRPTK
ncbi:MAG: hypothetical protein Barrevirus2_21 [Barrevirus sp.]|uniref:Uncharacterized protein n=1 Tax=Barrevirus sp. TaxID=2487763 RepID=A0A3G4ZPP3_9VIRU|nr:MAG: hypothetical protein Barrevirus2_21 [Barrevirus sp.]